jgi:hypothetical protein
MLGQVVHMERAVRGGQAQPPEHTAHRSLPTHELPRGAGQAGDVFESAAQRVLGQ